jgi:hypothetical protein
MGEAARLIMLIVPQPCDSGKTTEICVDLAGIKVQDIELHKNDT